MFLPLNQDSRILSTEVLGRKTAAQCPAASVSFITSIFIIIIIVIIIIISSSSIVLLLIIDINIVIIIIIIIIIISCAGPQLHLRRRGPGELRARAETGRYIIDYDYYYCYY